MNIQIAGDAIFSIRAYLRDTSLTAPERTSNLIALAHHCSRAGLAREGLNAVKEAIELADKTGLTGVRADALNAAAMCHYFRGDYLMTVACSIDAYIEYESRNQYAEMGHALTNISAACKDVDALDLAEHSLKCCLEIAIKTNDAFLMARTQNTLGVMYGDSARWQEAEASLVAALSALKQTVHNVHLPKVIANRGSLLKKQAASLSPITQQTQAITLIREGMALVQQGLDAAAQCNNQYEIADKHSTIGEYHLLLGEHDAARRYVNTALSMAIALKHPHLIAESHLILGRIYLAEQDVQAAITTFKKGLDCAKQNDMKPMQSHFNIAIADASIISGNVIEAEQYRAAANEWSDYVRSVNREVAREVRNMWDKRFSHHPMISSSTAHCNNIATRT